MEIKEQLGYLTAMLEGLVQNQQGFKDSHAILQERMERIEDELSMYKTIYKTVKFIGMALIALLTFKWALILDLWTAFRT